MSLEKKFTVSGSENLNLILESCNFSKDINFSEFQAGSFHGVALWCEGMTDSLVGWELLFRRLEGSGLFASKDVSRFLDKLFLEEAVVLGIKKDAGLHDALLDLMSGCYLLLLDRAPFAIAFPAQGFAHRSVSEGSSEENVRGPREAFCEALKENMSLIRRRLKTPNLVFHAMRVGKYSSTEVMVVYLKDKASKTIVDSICSRLEKLKINSVLDSGYIEPFLENGRLSIFSGVGHTERPDTLCGKLLEGRIGILVDGTPFALTLPYLFIENFVTMDDYTNKPYYASFIRCLRYFCFFISFLLPGLFVAAATFRPAVLPLRLSYSIASAESATPLPMMLEALLMNTVYEIVKEAGLRLPRPIGHAVSLIGALVVGEAAVSAGIVSPAMVMVIALTSVGTFTIPMLYEPISLLRYVFILAGGLAGFWGVNTMFCATLFCICGINTYGVPYTTPVTPYGNSLFRDGLIKRGWNTMNRESKNIDDLPGSHPGGSL